MWLLFFPCLFVCLFVVMLLCFFGLCRHLEFFCWFFCLFFFRVLGSFSFIFSKKIMFFYCLFVCFYRTQNPTLSLHRVPLAPDRVACNQWGPNDQEGTWGLFRVGCGTEIENIVNKLGKRCWYSFLFYFWASKPWRD